MPSPYLDHTTGQLKEGVHAFIDPLTSRRVNLRVFAIPRSSTIITAEQKIIQTPWLELKPLEWQPLSEGEVNPIPFATSSGYDDTKGAIAIIQAMVNLGHALGLKPDGTEDRSKEIAALRNHLDDMRILAGVKPKAII